MDCYLCRNQCEQEPGRTNLMTEDCKNPIYKCMNTRCEAFGREQ